MLVVLLSLVSGWRTVMFQLSGDYTSTAISLQHVLRDHKVLH